VISSEAIDNVQIVPKSLLVLLSSQSGPHLALLDADPVQVVLAEKQMVRAHFARNRQSLRNTKYANRNSRETETENDALMKSFQSKDLRRNFLKEDKDNRSMGSPGKDFTS